ncbi:sodium- and chloride-dependent glycine transporter 1-like isoform X2 [Mizuhopecten yessoensis]|uniref:Sodium-and chloride-dependent glycine transporter 1 n=1 Tax=Mizuhopecten yessoensis TaxID=6573 RepID=A0A210QY83_MIZYE|nr:sodium- and chloride-dependent glycine transporter 1-like isoform X2 [Mizuhopecten yessoensis]OWF53686.1 Sodium- and chloride-dependent glycine transporter 1 [Mizuhopecten yessoensis]
MLVTVCACAFYFFLGLVFCTQAGIYVYQLLDWYVSVAIPVFGLIECLVFGWIYGAERFSRDIEMMLGRGVPVFVRICWCFVTPVVLLILFVSTFISYKPPTYGDYVYPSYVNLLGWCVGLMPLLPVIVVGVGTVANTPGHSIIQRLKSSMRPSPFWKPISKRHAFDYDAHESAVPLSFWKQVKVNIFGGNDAK